MSITLLDVLRVYPDLFENDAEKEKYLISDKAEQSHFLATRSMAKLIERTDELTALKKKKIFTNHEAMDSARELIDTLETRNRIISELADLQKKIIAMQDAKIADLEEELNRREDSTNE